MLHHSMAYETMYAHDLVSRLDCFWPLTAKPNTLLCEHEQQRDFARAIAARASNTFGLITKNRITQVLVAIRKASRATRPGLAVGSSAGCVSFTRKRTNATGCVDWDALINPIVYGITTSALACTKIISDLWRHADDMVRPLRNLARLCPRHC